MPEGGRARCSQETQQALEQLERLAAQALVAGGLSERGQGQHGEDLAEGVAAHAEGAAGAVDEEVHLAVRVEAVPPHEVMAVAGKVEPLGARRDGAVEGGPEPGGAADEPHGLVGAVERAGAIEAGEKAAVLPVDAVAHPEGHDIIEQRGAVLVAKLPKAGGVHNSSGPGRSCSRGPEAMWRKVARNARRAVVHMTDIPLTGCAAMISRHRSPEMVRLRMTEIMPSTPTRA